MNYKDYSDSELLCLVKEESEEAKDIIFDKYKYIIGVVIKKYTMTAKILNMEYKDLYQEALLGFADAINRYDDTSSSLPTFITLCVDRRLQVVIRKAQSLKSKLMSDSLSLDYSYIENQPLRELISDENKNNPLNNLEMDEDYLKLVDDIKHSLSENEQEVFALMAKNYNYQEIAEILNKNPKQIDNATQRIKSKVKTILEQREE